MDTGAVSLAERDRYVAYVGMFAGNNASIWGQYDRLVDFIFESYSATARRFDEIALPLLNTMAHGIELALKENISFFQEYNEISHLTKYEDWTALTKSHDLSSLADEFKIAYTRLHSKLSLSQSDLVEFNTYYQPLLKLIDILDRSAETYRYATKIGKNGDFVKMSIEYEKKIDILEIKQLFDQTKTLFIGAPNSVGHYTDFIDYKRAHPDYDAGKGYLYCQRLHYTGWFLEQLKEKFNQEFVQVQHELWFDQKTNENYEIKVWENNIYIIAVDIGKAIKERRAAQSEQINKRRKR